MEQNNNNSFETAPIIWTGYKHEAPIQYVFDKNITFSDPAYELHPLDFLTLQEIYLKFCFKKENKK